MKQRQGISLKKINHSKISLIAVIILLLITLNPIARADNFRMDGDTLVERGITLDFDEGNFRLGLFPGVLTKQATIQLLRLDEEMPGMEGLTMVSPIYQMDLLDKEAYDARKAIVMEIRHSSENGYLKSVYFWNGVSQEWQMLPSSTDYSQKVTRAKIYLPFARFAVFETSAIMEQGNASWYSYRACNCAASPDYPKGTRLKVTNIDNNKSVEVVVNDYGPDRRVHPDRVVDLDRVAFRQIAELSQGIARVKVEVAEESRSILAKEVANKTAVPEIESAAGIIINEDTEEVLFLLNADQKLPIASITKLVAAQVFLDTDPDFEKKVTYNSSDDREGAALYIKHGDQLKIKDLFYAAMIGSKNNAVISLVRVAGMSEQEFVARMNEKARSWGLKQTYFADPTGLSEKNQSTAREVALIAKKSINNLLMLQGTTLQGYSFTTLKNDKNIYIGTTNRLLNSEYYVTGAKTGYIREAGHCLVMRVREGGESIISVILGGPNSNARYADMRSLINYGINKLKN